MTIYLIKKAKIILGLIEKVIILAKYSRFINVFFKKLEKLLPKY